MKYKNILLRYFFYCNRVVVFVFIVLLVLFGGGRVSANCSDFGVKITPSFIDFKFVSGGDRLLQNIELTRTCSSVAYGINAIVDDCEIADWIYFEPDLKFDKGEVKKNIELKIDVPDDIDLGRWVGSFILKISSDEKIIQDGSLVDINIGIRPTINIDVVKKGYIKIYNNPMVDRLRGKIVIKTEDLGRAFYIHPVLNKMFFLGSPKDAFSVMRSQGVGISNNDLTRFIKNGKTNENILIDSVFLKEHVGKIFLQVEKNGEAWYVNPENKELYFLGRPTDAFRVMRELGLGISNNDFDLLVNK